MKDTREEYYDEVARVAVTRVDVTSAAAALQNAHLMEDLPAKYLAEGLVIAALLGAEMSEKDETVIVQMKCSGSLGGYLVECTSEGLLRGYTEKKTGVEGPLGKCRYQITRSVPGRILSQGLAESIDGYLADSLQRRAKITIDDVSGEMVEILPDATATEYDESRLTLKKTTPLKFGCRCSPDRAVAMLSSLSSEERQGLGKSVDITCHMCGRTFTVTL